MLKGPMRVCVSVCLPGKRSWRRWLCREVWWRRPLVYPFAPWRRGGFRCPWKQYHDLMKTKNIRTLCKQKKWTIHEHATQCISYTSTLNLTLDKRKIQQYNRQQLTHTQVWMCLRLNGEVVSTWHFKGDYILQQTGILGLFGQCVWS